MLNWSQYWILYLWFILFFLTIIIGAIVNIRDSISNYLLKKHLYHKIKRKYSKEDPFGEETWEED